MRRRGPAGAAAVALTLLAGCGSAPRSTSVARPAGPAAASVTSVAAPAATSASASSAPAAAATTAAAGSGRRRARRPAPARRHGPPYAVGERTIRLVESGRTVTFPGRAPEPRTLQTVVRYPAVGAASPADLHGAAPDTVDGPYPLVIFGHGFAVTPAYYHRLLHAWAQAGYVVAAPVFPLENEHAPGGPNENDLVNQPADMSEVMSGIASLAGPGAHSALRGLVQPRQIAVTGQSDGGDTALAVAYDRQFLDHRVRAAVILSGAQIPGIDNRSFVPAGPPLLATQGTADTINPPGLTYSFFALARPPKYLLSLTGAPHLPPYTSEEPQLGIVERVTTAFLDRYLKGEAGGLGRMKRAGDVGGVAALQADP